jgi:hypothetical protein
VDENTCFISQCKDPFFLNDLCQCEPVKLDRMF